MFRIGITFDEVLRHTSRLCASGHEAPEKFRRGGPSDEPTPTRFFKVTGQGIEGKIFCEPCVMIANWYSEMQKKGKVK